MWATRTKTIDKKPKREYRLHETGRVYGGVRVACNIKPETCQGFKRVKCH